MALVGDGTPKPAQQGALSLTVLRDVSGAPKGVQVSWTRVDVAGVLGYYIYRDTSSLPGGDPAGHASKRVNGGNRIDQSGSGTDTLSFDDLFSATFETTYYYRMTVVNATNDESDFSNQASITIATHTIDDVTQAGSSIGDEVTITGTHFGDNQESDKVYFTNASGNTVVEATSYVSWSMTQIKVGIPYGAADGRVGVEIAGTAVYSDPLEITYNEPVITAITPGEDWVQHDYLVIDGSDFGPAPSSGGSETYVYFGATAAEIADIDEVAWTSSQIKVKVPAAAVGKTVNVKVSVAGNDSNLEPFIILPHLDSLDNTSGATGDSLVLTGTNFGGTQGASTVTLDGVTASVSAWSNSSVTITVPASATDGAVVLHRDDGKDTNGLEFDVTPTLTTISPGRRMIGEQLTITGSGFGASQGGSKVTFDGAPVDAANYLSWAPGQIVVEVPAGAKSGTVTVSVSDNAVGSDLDSVSSASSLKILLPPPDITDIGQQ